jgi:Holliday junction DNA helicase RuvA
MLSLLTGTLLSKDLDRAEVLTPGGVGYELFIPLGTYEALPRAGEQVRLHTSLVVREDEWLLYGFATPFERAVFRKLLLAKGVGPALALGMLSTLSPERLVRAIREKDLVTLQQVPRVGRKKAEQLILDLADKLDEVASAPADGTRPVGASDADARARPRLPRLRRPRRREGGARCARVDGPLWRNVVHGRTCAGGPPVGREALSRNR